MVGENPKEILGEDEEEYVYEEVAVSEEAALMEVGQDSGHRLVGARESLHESVPFIVAINMLKYVSEQFLNNDY